MCLVALAYRISFKKGLKGSEITQKIAKCLRLWRKSMLVLIHKPSTPPLLKCFGTLLALWYGLACLVSVIKQADMLAARIAGIPYAELDADTPP